MEAEAAPILWGRSEEQHRLRYTTFIGDGDSKGFTAVTNASPYGPDVAIEKEECVGHVQKRVGTNLRKLKKELSGKKLSDNKTIGGRGRLTDGMIDSLQNYLQHGSSSQRGRLASHVPGDMGIPYAPCLNRRKAAAPVLPSWNRVMVWLAGTAGWWGSLRAPQHPPKGHL